MKSIIPFSQLHEAVNGTVRPHALAHPIFHHIFSACLSTRIQRRHRFFSPFSISLLLHYSLCDRTRVLRLAGRRFNYLRSCFRHEMPYVRSLKFHLQYDGDYWPYLLLTSARVSRINQRKERGTWCTTGVYFDKKINAES